jgi:ABC-2 type transport system ATP-binding protein
MGVDPLRLMPPAIAAERLTKWYGPRLAVHDVSFDVEAGEVMGLLGPNGSGKTTVLRMIAGYLRPSAGTLRLAGLDTIDGPLESRRQIGYVPEEAPLYDWMKVDELLAFMGRLKGLGGATLHAAERAVVERLALGDVRRLPVGKLSRGYRQRVAVAQALLSDPPILVFDEPTNGLDPHQIIEVRELIRSLAGSHTILVASHILHEMERVADRVAILLGGRLLAIHALSPGGGQFRVRVRVTGDEAAVRACLETVAGVRAVAAAAPGPSGAPVTWRVHADGPDVHARLAAALVERGFALAELTEDPIDLEALFLDLTSRPAPGSP